MENNCLSCINSPPKVSNLLTLLIHQEREVPLDSKSVIMSTEEFEKYQMFQHPAISDYTDHTILSSSIATMHNQIKKVIDAGWKEN